MTFRKKAAVVVAASLAALAAAHFSPLEAAPGSKSDPETLVVDEATIVWIEKANVAALREGVVEKMELQIGMPVAKGKPIGYLHSEMADLAVKKAEVAVKSQGPKAKAQAQKEVAAAIVAINKRLNDRMRGTVSYEEQAKAEADLKVAEASRVEAEERIMLDQADLNLALRTLEEHTIVAPFDGVVIERMKNPGESVRANEAVVKLGNLSKLRAYAYVPLDYSFRVKEGQVVELQLRLQGDRRNPLPIEQKRFRGKITFIDPEIQPIAETTRRIYAEFDNKDFELSPGLKATMTIFLNSEGPAPARPSAPAVGARTPAGGVGR